MVAVSKAVMPRWVGCYCGHCGTVLLIYVLVGWWVSVSKCANVDFMNLINSLCPWVLGLRADAPRLAVARETYGKDLWNFFNCFLSAINLAE